MKNKMRVTVDFNYMMEKSLGDKGIKNSELAALEGKAAEAFNYVKTNRGRDDLFMGWTELPYNQTEIRRRYFKDRGRGQKKIQIFCRARYRRQCARTHNGVQRAQTSSL